MNVRLAVVHPSRKHDPLVLVNPEITAEGREDASELEGCLSIPGIRMPVYRPRTISVRALDAEGEPLELEAKGMLARVIGHELDHLDGTLICDHLTGPDQIGFWRWYRCTALGLAGGSA